MKTHRPTECEFCGCSEVARDGYLIGGERIVTFRCGTLWTPDDGIAKWWQDKVGCGEHVGELYRRIRRALETLKATERRYVSNGFAMYVDARDVEHAVKILEGNDAKTD